MAERVKARFYDNPGRMIMGSTRTLITLLLSWIRRFTMIISAWWLQTSSNFTLEKVKHQSVNTENSQVLNGRGLRIRRKLTRIRRLLVSGGQTWISQ